MNTFAHMSHQIVARTFSDAQVSHASPGRLGKSLNEYFGQPAVVVIGDSGAGKTESFRQAAKMEPEAQYVTVRDFLTFPPDKWRDRVLYLDGLDEQRSRTRQGTDILDKVRCRLYDLGCPKFRLSCRAGDWYGGIDVESLRTVSSSNEVFILRIDPLSENDIIEIAQVYIPKPLDFKEEAKRRSIYELLLNPQTLLLILKVVQEGNWPNTRTELYDKACKILAKELNEEHARAGGRQVKIDDVLIAAGALCTYHLLGNVQGFSISEPSASDDFPWLGDLRGDLAQFLVASTRRLFTFVDAERFSPVHRTIAEYLAASYLSELIKKGFPIKRVLALMTGYDGGPLSDLRGLLAWLSCGSPGYAHTLISKDPLGMVLYGDPSCLSKPLKNSLLEELGGISKRDPFFRSENWARAPFGALSSAEMTDTFFAILKDKKQEEAFLGCVLDAIAHGPALNELGDELLNVIRDNTWHLGLREKALDAYINVRPEDRAGLKTVLADVNEGKIGDKNDQLRGRLLSALYPKEVSPSEVLEYLIPGNDHFIGQYHMFLRYELPEKTPSSHIPELLDELSSIGKQSGPRKSRFHYRYIGELLIRGVNLYGEGVEPPRLYAWLGAPMIDGYDSVLESEQQEQIKKWLEDRPDVIKRLYLCAVSDEDSQDRSWQEHKFWRRVYHVKPPKDFGRWLLEVASGKNTPRDLSLFLFQMAALMSYNQDSSVAPSLDELYSYAEDYPVFRDILGQMMVCKISDWRIESGHRTEKERARKEKWRKQKVKALRENEEMIRSGRALGDLSFLANTYYAAYVDVNSDLAKPERIAATLAPELVEPALKGFVEVLFRSDLPSPGDIGDLETHNKRYNIALPVLAGMEILSEESPDSILGLPDETIMSALAFHLNSPQNGEKGWFQDLILEKPLLSARTFEDYWRPQLKKGAEHISGIYQIRGEEYMKDVAKILTVKLLNDFPTCKPRNLETLLISGLKNGNHEDLLYVANEKIKSRGQVRGKTRVLWVTAAFILDPPRWAKRFVSYVGSSTDRVLTATGFLKEIMDAGVEPAVRGLPINDLASLIKVLGRSLQPYSLPSSGTGAHWSAYEASNMVSKLIEWLGDRMEDDVPLLFNHLRQIKRLSRWDSVIAHNLELHLKKRRELTFQPPTLDQVMTTLDLGIPANVGDLHGIVCEYLQEIAQEIENSATDRYKLFWNVDKHSRPTTPRPENDGRDRLLEILRDKLRPLGIDAEPEGHYARQKRADIKVLYRQMNVPIEIKRHYHRDLWSAMERQLIGKYTRDPGAQGWGIYLVLWFGLKWRKLPKLPNGVSSPKTHEELRRAISGMVPPGCRNQIEAVCIDCSRPKIKMKKGSAKAKKPIKIKGSNRKRR